MPLPEFLQARKKQAEARAAQPQEDAAKKAQLLQEVKQKAQQMRDLLANPLHAGYGLLLDEAASAFQAQLNVFDGTAGPHGTPLTDTATLMRLGRLQGYVEILQMIRRMPEALIALAEQGSSPEGDGRHPTPRATHPDASTAR